jgi:26S proteasome regulatory subunit N11
MVNDEESKNDPSSGENLGKNSKEELVSLSETVNSVTILASLLDEITEYSVNCIPKEAIGLLGGSEIRSKELLVDKIVFVSEGDEVSVSFSEENFATFEDILDETSYCVGWWHSHPGYGLFLSQTDISTQIYSFQLHNLQSVALVIEPTIIDTNGRAAFQFFQVNGEQGKTPFTYKEIASFIQN